MTADGRALLEAVRDDPDADLPRLVLADWLDDHGEPGRAELIRVGCHLTRPRCADLCQCYAHDEFQGCGACGPCLQAVALLDRHDELLAAEARRWPDAIRAGGRYDRGLLVSVACEADAWAVHGDDVLALEPVRTVWLTRLDVPGGLSWATAADWRAAYAAAGVTADEYLGGGQEAVDRVCLTLFTRRWPGVGFARSIFRTRPESARLDLEGWAGGGA